jgi:hypothetical protein
MARSRLFGSRYHKVQIAWHTVAVASLRSGLGAYAFASMVRELQHPIMRRTLCMPTSLTCLML